MDDDDKEYYMQFIQKKDDEYIIHRLFNDNDYVFNTCSSLDEALVKCEELDKDGWPLKINRIHSSKKINVNSNIRTLDTKEDIITTIKMFINNYITILPRKVRDNDVTIEQIYIIFKNNTLLDIDESTFETYFYNVYREYRKASVIFNNTTRYNLEFKNINETIVEESYSHFINNDELINRIDNFIMEYIGIYPDEANEDDITVNEIYQAFSDYIHQYNEYTKLKLFKKYFDKIYFQYENADKYIDKYIRYNAAIITDESKFEDY